MSARTVVPRLTVQVLRQAFARLSHGSPYYIREEGGRDSIRGCYLRVQRRSVQFGIRTAGGDRWIKVREARSDMTLEEVDDAREAVRSALRAIETENEFPGLLRGRQMTVRQLSGEYLRDYEENRSSRRSPRTLASYRSVWNTHILPLLGRVRIREVTPDVVRQLKRQVSARANQRPEMARAGGVYIANRALQQLDSAFRFAVRNEWVIRNPASQHVVARYEESPADEFLDDAGYAAVGAVLRDLEADTIASPFRTRESRIRTLYALRLAIYTGARHREEILWAHLPWCEDLDGTIPRIAIPRAKGDRGNRRGRWIYLGPDAARLIREMPRQAGSEHLLVPSMRAGRPMSRLNEIWDLVLQRAGLPHMTVKVLRHSFRTHAVNAGLLGEFTAQLLGHRGAPVTDTVYLKRHGQALACAAATIEDYLRYLMGDLRPTADVNMSAHPSPPAWQVGNTREHRADRSVPA
jgi:integrase